MGADYRAKAVIGLRVSGDDLFVEKTVKAFDHDFDAETLYHPKTGAKLWKEVREPIEGFNGDDRLGLYRVAYGTDGEYRYIALRIADDTYSNGGNQDCRVNLNFNDLADQIANFKTEMTQLGLWDHKEFGLWAVLYCSY